MGWFGGFGLPVEFIDYFGGLGVGFGLLSCVFFWYVLGLVVDLAFGLYG